MNIAIIGYGVVGSGVYQVLKTNAASIYEKVGKEITVKRILDIRDFDDHPEKELFTKSFEDLLNDDSIEIVCETVGGATFAYEYTKALLKAGKSVATSNKELVATHGTELFAIAKENGVCYRYEAAVGGGIPLIQPIAESLSANKITDIYGVLNGTTNYILTKMFKEGLGFDEALFQAQALGYAERDPSADVDGVDACRKIAILTSLVTGRETDASAVPTEGIRSITAQEVAFAEVNGYVIKLIGHCHIEDKRAYARVCPMLVKKGNPLSVIEDVFNGALIHGNAVDDVLLYGRGAGKMPTASAVAADVVAIARGASQEGYSWVENPELPLDETKYEASFMVRIPDSGKAAAADIFGDIAFTEGDGSCAFFTPKMSLKSAEERISHLGGVISKIRVMA